MAFDFALVAVFLVVACVVVGGALFLGRFLRPSRPDALKAQTYECGEQPIGSGWFNFNPRFYQLALLFLVFDVDIALTWPVAAAVRRWIGLGQGWLAVVEILLFLLVLVVTLAFLWGRGDLDWVRDVGVIQDDPAQSPGSPRRTP